MGGSAAISLSLLCLGPERKVKCYNEYFVNGYVFHTEEYGHGRKTYNNGVCINGQTFSEFEVHNAEAVCLHSGVNSPASTRHNGMMTSQCKFVYVLVFFYIYTYNIIYEQLINITTFI